MGLREIFFDEPGYNKLYIMLEGLGFDMGHDPNYPGNVVATRQNNGKVERVYLEESTASYFVGDTEVLVDVSFKEMWKYIKKLPK